MSNSYYIVNRETEKLELHFEKADYIALSDDLKKEVKSSFLWGRNSGCWISRCKEPNLAYARRVAEKLGLENAGATGERLTMAEKIEVKVAKAERRAERYDNRADAAEARAEALQKPINDMHGDIAFFTQPNINTSSGRAFTRRRERMWASFEKGFEEFHKSGYYRSRANAARVTAAQGNLKDPAFLERRIKERESSIKKVQKNAEDAEKRLERVVAGEVIKTWDGVQVTTEKAEENFNYYLDRIEVLLDELGFYQDCLEAVGGIKFSKAAIKVGYTVKVARWGLCEVLSTGPKNCVIKVASAQGFPLTVSYAEITEIVKAEEKKAAAHPFKVGEKFTYTRWNSEKHDSEEVTAEIIKATDKTVTLKVGDEKPFNKKPTVSKFSGDWVLALSDWRGGIFYKKAE